MTVSDVFSIRGPLRVDGIEAFRKTLQQAEAGENVGLLFGSLDRDRVKAGDVVQTTGL